MRSGPPALGNVYNGRWSQDALCVGRRRLHPGQPAPGWRRERGRALKAPTQGTARSAPLLPLPTSSSTPDPPARDAPPDGSSGRWQSRSPGRRGRRHSADASNAPPGTAPPARRGTAHPRSPLADAVGVPQRELPAHLRARVLERHPDTCGSHFLAEV